jgi:Phosphoesterase family
MALGAASLALPPNVRKAIAAPPPNRDRKGRGGLDDIEHVVLLMQANRSVDHYVGPCRAGFDDPRPMRLPGGRTVLYQPDLANPQGYLQPYRLNTKISAAQAIPSTSHAWEVQHAAWDGGKTDDWLPAHIAADGSTDGPYTMGYLTGEDIPFHDALADALTSSTTTTARCSARRGRTGTCGCRARSTPTAWPVVPRRPPAARRTSSRGRITRSGSATPCELACLPAAGQPHRRRRDQQVHRVRSGPAGPADGRLRHHRAAAGPTPTCGPRPSSSSPTRTTTCSTTSCRPARRRGRPTSSS